MRRRPRPPAAWSPSLQKRNHHTHIFQFRFKGKLVYSPTRLNRGPHLARRDQGETYVRHIQYITYPRHVYFWDDSTESVLGTTDLNCGFSAKSVNLNPQDASVMSA